MRHNPSEKNKNCFALPDFLFLLLWLVSLSITVWLALEYGVVKLNESWQTYEEQQQEEEYREDDLIDDVLDPSVVACEHIVKIAAWCALFAGSLAFRRCVAAWAPCVYTCVRNPASLRPHLAVSSELYFVFALRERCLSHYLWPISETKNRSPIFLSSWCPLAMSQQQSP